MTNGTCHSETDDDENEGYPPRSMLYCSPLSLYCCLYCTIQRKSTDWGANGVASIARFMSCKESAIVAFVNRARRLTLVQAVRHVELDTKTLASM